MNVFTQTAFKGGMNMLADESRIGTDQYVIGFNVRSRFDYLEPIRKPLELVSPVGKKQGLFIFGELKVLIVAGVAYYQTPSSSTWVNIIGFSMSPNAEYVYGCAIPASLTNFSRQMIGSANYVNGAMILLNSQVSSSPAALLLQDGISQPWIIFPDGTARVTKTYNQWTKDTDQEYVPIGRQMVWFGGKLYLVSADGKRLLHSVSGRPLDFMVNIDRNGNKLATELLGGADTVSHSVGFNEITCLQALNTSSLIVANVYNATAVEPDYTNKIFGEPTFRNIPLFESGIVNQYSTCELLGDYAMIDFEGLKSFNAVQQLSFEGRNAAFSRLVAPLFGKLDSPVIQDTCAAVQFDNYGLFAVKTTLGYVTLVYDALNSCWASVDIGIASPIKQFAVSTNRSENKLYCITGTDKLYQLYGSTTYDQPQVNSRAVVITTENGPNLEIEQKNINFRAVLSNATTTGTFYAIEYVDNKRGVIKSKPLLSIAGGVAFPVGPPVMPDSQPRLDNIVLHYEGGQSGWKVNYWFSWNNDAKLTYMQIETNPQTFRQSQLQQSRNYV